MLLTTPARSTPYPLSVMAPEPHIPPRQVLSEADLASRWGMSPKTLQRWRMEGRGPHYLKLGKRVARFRIDDGDLQVEVSQPKEIFWDQQHLSQIWVR